jgi:hypothetical protein
MFAVRSSFPSSINIAAHCFVIDASLRLVAEVTD